MGFASCVEEGWFQEHMIECHTFVIVQVPRHVGTMAYLIPTSLVFEVVLRGLEHSTFSELIASAARDHLLR